MSPNSLLSTSAIVASSLVQTPASWSSDNAVLSGMGGLTFKSQACEIGHNVENGSPPPQHFVKRSCLPWRYDAEMGTANLLHASALYSEYNEAIDLLSNNMLQNPSIFQRKAYYG